MAELSSWHDTATRQAIVRFVEAVTLEGGLNYVPPEERIATSDNTALASQLAYSQTSDYVSVPAASFEVAVNAAASGKNALTQTVELEGNMVYDLVFMGDPGDDKPLTLTPLADDTLERGTPESTPSS